MNNLRKFATEAEYSAATLNYPSVAWVTGSDSIHFDKTEPTPEPNDKIILSFVATATTTSDVVLFNGGVSGADTGITSCTLNDVDVFSSLSEGVLQDVSLVSGTVYTAKIGIVGTEDGGWFSSATLGTGEYDAIEILFPAQMTSIGVPTNTAYNKLVCQSTTPPVLSSNWSGDLFTAYVPDESVNDYKNTEGWSENAQYIFPLSQYSGNLPV